MKIEPIAQSSLVEQTEQRILETIRVNKLGVGDSLPGEVELTEQLGVSRPVVREALSRLRMLGLLETRKKRGIVVAEPDVFAGCSQVLDPAFLKAEAQEDLWELRLVLEMGLADLVFLRMTDEHLERLKEIAARGRKARTRASQTRLDIEFHAALYESTGNPILHRLQALLQPFFQRAAQVPAARKSTGVSHGDLVKELETGTPESFRTAMRTHLKPHFEQVRKG